MADSDGKKANQERKGKGITRRQFVAGTGVAVVVGGVAGGVIGSTVLSGGKSVSAPASFTEPGGQKHVKGLLGTLPEAKAYLVVDSLKCCGCQSCMMACSMVHEGVSDTSLSRIQVVQSAFTTFPDDLKVFQCRQCTVPVCVLNCPTGACHIDTANGNVRVIDQGKCIGCKTCINTCPHPPHRTVWNPEINKASKCDLCINTPYWNEKGGPGGKQACVSVCTMDCLKVVTTTPSQSDTSGYEVNLRTGGAPVPTTP